MFSYIYNASFDNLRSTSYTKNWKKRKMSSGMGANEPYIL